LKNPKFCKVLGKNPKFEKGFQNRFLGTLNFKKVSRTGSFEPKTCKKGPRTGFLGTLNFENGSGPTGTGAGS
jgi:hypothetical protein